MKSFRYLSSASFLFLSLWKCNGISDLIGDAYMHNQGLEAAKYGSLPHTIFSPEGRLFNVEKTAMMASDPDDSSSSFVLALQFGSNTKHNGILIMSYNSKSPFLDYFRKNETKTELDQISDSGSVDDRELKSLWTFDHNIIMNDIRRSSVSFPILQLPNHIFVGTGGNAADARALMKKIRDISLSIFRQNDGMRSTHNLEGTSVTASIIAKAVADANHLPTQDANANRMLASSALIIGSDAPTHITSSKYSIWRCDPTGQFFRCTFGSVGRGAGNADRTILSHIAAWKVRGEKHIGMDLSFDGNGTYATAKDRESSMRSTLSKKDVKLYFDTMEFDDAVFTACCAIRSAIGVKYDEQFQVDQFSNGVQGIFLSTQGSIAEKLHPSVIKEAFRSAVLYP